MGIWWYFCSQCHLGLHTMQEPSYLDKIAQVSLRFRMVLAQIITQIHEDSHTLTYPPNVNIWLVLQIWCPQVGFLIPLLMLIIDTMHSPIYRSNIERNNHLVHHPLVNCDGVFLLDTKVTRRYTSLYNMMFIWVTALWCRPGIQFVLLSSFLEVFSKSPCQFSYNAKAFG